MDWIDGLLYSLVSGSFTNSGPVKSGFSSDESFLSVALILLERGSTGTEDSFELLGDSFDMLGVVLEVSFFLA